MAVRNKISNTEMYKNEKTLMLKKAQQMFFLTWHEEPLAWTFDCLERTRGNVGWDKWDPNYKPNSENQEHRSREDGAKMTAE